MGRVKKENEKWILYVAYNYNLKHKCYGVLFFFQFSMLLLTLIIILQDSVLCPWLNTKTSASEILLSAPLAKVRPQGFTAHFHHILVSNSDLNGISQIGTES